MSDGIRKALVSGRIQLGGGKVQVGDQVYDRHGRRVDGPAERQRKARRKRNKTAKLSRRRNRDR